MKTDHGHVRLLGALATEGLSVVGIPSPQSSIDFRRRWRETFGSPHVDWSRARDEWDVLDTEVAPARSRRAAIREFERQRSDVGSFFVTLSLDHRDVLEVDGRQPDHAWWRAVAGSGDLFLVPGDWRWSFVLSHEEEAMGIGPFFVEANGVVNVLSCGPR